MKVIAKKKGFYDNKRVYKGQEIILHDKKLFSDNWMVPADGKAVPEQKAPKAPKKEKPVGDVI